MLRASEKKIFLLLPCLTWNLFMVSLHKIFRLIFHKQPLCPKKIFTEHGRKLTNSRPFSEIFLKEILLNMFKQLRWMCYWFISKVKWGFHRASFRSGCFELLFCFNSAILISAMTLLLFNFSTIFSVTNLAMYWLRREICTSLQLQRSPLIEFWEAI